MNPLINSIFLFCVGILILAVTQAYDNWDVVKADLRRFRDTLTKVPILDVGAMIGATVYFGWLIYLWTGY